MESLENFNQKPEKGSGKIFLVVGIIGILVIAGIAALLYSLPSRQERQQATIEGSFREGTPEFDTLTKKIVLENDPDRATTESPTAMGSIQMSIWGRVKNLSDKTLTGLEIKVSVIDLAGNPVKEKTEIVIPKKQASLGPGQPLQVNIIMDGFKKEDNRANIRWKVTAIKTE